MKTEVITFESVNNEIYDETKLERMNVSPRVNDSISMTTAAPGTARYRKHTAGRRRGGDSSEPARRASTRNGCDRTSGGGREDAATIVKYRFCFSQLACPQRVSLSQYNCERASGRYASTFVQTATGIIQIDSSGGDGGTPRRRKECNIGPPHPCVGAECECPRGFCNLATVHPPLASSPA